MSLRQYSPQQMFLAMAQEHVPAYTYDGRPFEAWKAELLPQVLATLGRTPRAVDPEPELLRTWSHDGLRKQKWAIDVSPHASVEVQVNRMADLPLDQRLPAIFCCHGHDAAGKEQLMGNDPDDLNPLYFGHHLAKAGYVTFAIDFMGKGLRHDGPQDEYRAPGGRDWCNLYFLHAAMLGMTNLGINLCHARRSMDFVLSLPGVDAGRLAVMGWSNGGTMALWMGLTDPRFKAVEIISYSGLWADFAFHDLNYCGWQMTPGLFALLDVPDLQGLLAPLPLLVDIGEEDPCFPAGPSLVCHERLQAIYRAAGAEEALHLNLNTGGHGHWDPQKTMGFLNTYLASREES